MYKMSANSYCVTVSLNSGAKKEFMVPIIGTSANGQTTPAEGEEIVKNHLRENNLIGEILQTEKKSLDVVGDLLVFSIDY